LLFFLFHYFMYILVKLELRKIHTVHTSLSNQLHSNGREYDVMIWDCKFLLVSNFNTVPWYTVNMIWV
jgi:hypothetical protein